MRMTDPIPQFLYFIRELRRQNPDLAYIHMIESRGDEEPGCNDVFREAWAPKPFLSACGYTRESALKISREKGDIIVFGRHFLANVRQT